MEILPSLSDWISSNYNDLTVRENTPNRMQNLPVDSNSEPDEYQSVMSKPATAPPTAWEDFKSGLSSVVEDAKSPGKVVDFLAKTVIDPTTYLPALKFGAFAGAFRPSNSKLLPSVLTKIKEQLNIPNWIDQEKTALVGKLSDKELSKYGTPEFLLDKYLPSTKEGGTPEWLRAREVELVDFLTSRDITNIKQDAQFVVQAAKSKIPADIFGRNQDYLLREIRGEVSRGYNLEPDILAFRDQIKDARPIFGVNPTAAAMPKPDPGDISTALIKLNDLTQQSKFTPEQLSKKSLQQLLGVADSVEKEAQKSVEAITSFTKQRTAELKATQGFKNDLVELTDKNDFGAETEFLNLCIGAGGADPATGKFLPKWHPISGEDVIQNKGFSNSGEIYWGLKSRGSARYFSYRPDGLPEATIELRKDGTIGQFMTYGNEAPSPEVKAKVMEALKPIIKKMKYGDGRKYIPTRADPDLDPQDYIMIDVQRMLRNGQGVGAVDRAAADFNRMANEWDNEL